MSDLIETVSQMFSAGYERLRDGKCKGCGASIAWFKTTNKKMLPINLPIASDHATAVPHWTVCPNRKGFKSKADVARDREKMRADAVQALCQATQARAVIALYEEGPVVSWRNGIPGDELRHEGISGANKLRWGVITSGGKA